MDFVIDFVYVGNGDGIVIWGREYGLKDYVFFLDGGNKEFGEKIVEHYNTWIKPDLYSNRTVAFINSHPHSDHINGLIEIVKLLGNEISYGIYNDPVKFISDELRSNIKQSALRKEDRDIEHLYKSFQKVQELNELCERYNIKTIEALTDSIILDKIKIVSPSREYYTQKVKTFTNIDFLKSVDYSKPFSEVIELMENLKPCDIVDEEDDTSPENLSSTVIELLDSKNRRYLLTSDTGVESFDDMVNNGFNCDNLHIVQLPHHGSRRNINAKWIVEFNPTYFFVSAEGSRKHPRRAVINCIKRNLPDCKIYSTHRIKQTLSYTTNERVFPIRNWSKAEAL